jgi:hypothetical protein
LRERNGSRSSKESEMRIVEVAAAGVVAIAAQVLIMATVLI